MNPLVAVALFATPGVVGAASGSLDIGTMLASYGIAAPFAALCWWQMQRSQKKLDDAESTIAELNASRLSDQRDFISRMAPMLYDSARLYQRGNEQLSQGLEQVTATPPELRVLTEQVRQLLERMEAQ